MLVEPAHDKSGFIRLPVDQFRIVDSLEQEVPESIHGLVHGGAYANNRLCPFACQALSSGIPRRVQDVADQSIDAFRTRPAHDRDGDSRQVVLSDDSGPQSVIHIVADISDDIGDLAYLPFESSHCLPALSENACPRLGVLHDALSRLKSEVQPLAAVLYQVDHAQALLVVPEAKGRYVVQNILSRMSKGRVSQVMAQSYGLCQVFVEI